MSDAEHDYDDLVTRTESQETEFFVDWRYDFFGSTEPSCREFVVSARKGREFAAKLQADDSRVISAGVFKRTTTVEALE